MNKIPKILFVEDNKGTREVIARFLRREGYEVVDVEAPDKAQDLLLSTNFDLILTDLKFSKTNLDGIELARLAKKLNPSVTSLIISGCSTKENSFQPNGESSFLYIKKPLDLEVLKRTIQDILFLLKPTVAETKKGGPNYLCACSKSVIVGGSAKMVELFNLLKRVAKTDSTVLITGETGTGKELIARAIHCNSKRKDKQMVTINCAAIPEQLLESELFGYIKGSFTGALADYPGKLSLAEEGTIFLDEIGDMSLNLQVKILRLIQEHEVFPIGSLKPKKVNVRIIGATNQQLEEKVKRGLFREDLYYRLNVIPIKVPPLRERIEDLHLLVEHFISIFNAKYKTEIEGIEPQALRLLENYSWPGNVRELENFIERTVILKRRGRIEFNDLPKNIINISPSQEEIIQKMEKTNFDLKEELVEFESKLIAKAMELSAGNKNRAARILQINRTTLLEKLKRIEKSQKKEA